jgi:hypothetical protein
MSQERSAEFWRGQREALRTLLTRIGGKRNTMLATWGSYTATDVEAIIREELDLLAAAEAREAGHSTAANRLRQAAIMASEPAASDLRAGAAAIEAITTQPTAAEVIEAAERALKSWRDAMNTHGEWDDGCFYYAKTSASELQSRIEGNAAALALCARWKEANGGTA